MKKLFFAAALLLISGVSKAAWNDGEYANYSSFTLTNEGPICVSTYSRGGLLIGVVIDTPAANGKLLLLDATNPTGVNTSTIGILSLAGSANPVFIPFNVRLSSGLSYQTSSNAGVSIIYRRTIPQ